MTHWLANNAVLTFVIIVVIGMLLTRGIGGSFWGRLLFMLIGGFVVLTLLVSFIQSLDAKYERFKGDITGFLKYKACQKFEFIGTLCDFKDLADAKENAEDRRMLCIEKVLQQDASDGGSVVKQACGIRTDRDVWEACVKQQAAKHEKLADDLLTGCPAFAPDTQLMHDVAEGTACPFGIKWLCTTSTDSEKKPDAPYVFDQNYVQCLANAINSQSIDAHACDQYHSDPQHWETCMVGFIQKGMSPAQAKVWLDACDAARARPKSP